MLIQQHTLARLARLLVLRLIALDVHARDGAPNNPIDPGTSLHALFPKLVYIVDRVQSHVHGEDHLFAKVCAKSGGYV